jgi:GNAT superfamily N-acetyltransferase
MTKRPRQLKLAFASTWPVKETMVFERLFHPKLRMSLGEKRDILRDAIAVWMYDATRGTLIGEIYSTPVEKELDPNEEGYADIAPYRGRKAAYVYSIGILKRFQGQQLGKVLKAYHLGRIRQAGFLYAIGHAKHPASCALNVAFGAKLLARHPNWYGTGQLFRFYELKVQ